MPDAPATILNVNDDEAGRYVLTRILETAGFTVSEARTGAEALQMAGSHPDLIVLDVQLPDINGFEVCRRIKGDPATSSIPILHLSASFVRSQDETYGLEGGADGYLTQPVEPPVLIAHVRSLLRMRRAEETALTRATQWQSTFDAIPDWVFLLDRAGRVLRCNRAMAEALQKPPEAIEGCLLSEVVPAGAALADELALARVEQTGYREVKELEIGQRWFRVTTDPVRGGPGATVGTVHIVADVTDRKRSEEALYESERRYRFMAESIPEIVWTAGPDGQLDYVNQRWAEYTGLTLEETIGGAWRDRPHPNDLQPTLAAWAKAVRTGSEFKIEHRIRRRDGVYRWLLTQAEPLRDDSGQIIKWFGTTTDINDQKQAAQRQRLFLRDVLVSVTGGKLRLCDTRADLPQPLPSLGDPIPLTLEGGLRELRRRTEQAAVARSFPPARWHDLVTATSEAGMNAVVHAGGGQGRVGADPAGLVQVWIEDTGTGIAVEHLPRATLERGYTTAGTLGQGMKMMLQTTDRIWLLTGTTGTTVVLEQDRSSPAPAWM